MKRGAYICEVYTLYYEVYILYCEVYIFYLSSNLIIFQGTEVKAITYSNMQIYDKEGQHEVFVIIDI